MAAAAAAFAFISPINSMSDPSRCPSCILPPPCIRLSGFAPARIATFRPQALPKLRPAIVFGKPSHPGPVRALSSATGDSSTVTALVTEFKHLLLPILDRNPYLSEATRQAAAVTTTLAKKYGADITVVVIDEAAKESLNDHDLRVKNIRWHLAEGGYDEFKLMERLGEGKKPAAVIGQVADDMGLDLVVLSMESIHSKHIDGNLLAEFLPCPVLLLPL
ncbi:hypothetical protein O6H91_03G071700 [Diphasiastrum complanatum]|uniref:Uncharacterized protein n=1 Tax=Diphasiastrum complanatum TaxID=34168 RepID=A0ACC2E7N5_DIPCM|nr:hypothetical protein O6H91_03G071700 [Diphasiastrum complanatum]